MALHFDAENSSLLLPLCQLYFELEWVANRDQRKLKTNIMGFPSGGCETDLCKDTLMGILSAWLLYHLV